MKTFLLAALAAIFFACAPALAADPTTVVIPLGEWVHALIPAAEVLFLGVLSWVTATYAPALYAILRTAQVEQLLTRAADYGFNAVAGATPQNLTIDTGNAVLREMLSYAFEHGGEWLTQFAGTPVQIAEKAFARLPFPPEMERPDFHQVVADATARPLT